MKIDDNFKRELINEREQAIGFFGQKGKEERERLIFRALLRGLEVGFSPSEIRSVDAPFPDVEFRGAGFEVKEMLDSGRRRHDEFKHSLARAKEVEDIGELIEPHKAEYISMSQVAHTVEQFLEDQCSKYPKTTRAGANLLVYFNRLKTFLDKTKALGPINIGIRGWQSVSVVGSSWCYVFGASAKAPPIIRENVGNLRQSAYLWD